MNCLIGIDEAGVGPVLGPLTVGGVRVEEKKLGLFKKAGVKDSKLFGNGKAAMEKRKTVWEQINGLTRFWLERITAVELDNHNWILLEVERIARIMIRLKWRETDRVFVGWVGNLGERRFLSLLYDSLRRKREINLWQLQEKLIYLKNVEQEPVAAAASILAKTDRDREVKKLCEGVGLSFVSGYCNSQTAEFLKKCKEEHGSLPSFVRKSRNWKPLQDLLS